MNAIQVLHGFLTVCTSTITQKASLLGWTAEAEAAKQYARDVYKKRGEFLVDLFEKEMGLHATSPEGAFYTMLDVRSLGDDIEVAEKCLQNRVVTVPGVAFGEEAKGFLRISFCNTEEKMAEGVRRMKEALDNNEWVLMLTLSICFFQHKTIAQTSDVCTDLSYCCPVECEGVGRGIKFTLTELGRVDISGVTEGIQHYLNTFRIPVTKRYAYVEISSTMTLKFYDSLHDAVNCAVSFFDDATANRIRAWSRCYPLGSDVVMKEFKQAM